MDDVVPAEGPIDSASLREGHASKSVRLSAQRERERVADAAISRSLRQGLWSARRTAVEMVRPIASRLLSPILPYSRVLQKKLQRPKPAFVKYDEEFSAGKPIIFHFLANFEIGGTPQLVCDIVEFTQWKYRHVVVSKHISRPVPYQGLEIIDMALPLRRYQLLRMIERSDPALMHVHYWNGMEQDFNWYHSVFQTIRNIGVPIVENVNTSGEPYFCDAIGKYVFCSEWSRRASGASWISEAVIYPGTRLDDFFRGDLSEVPNDHIGMVYRLGGDKIGPNAIEIFIEVMKACGDARCTIVGDGDLVQHFKARVEAEGLGSRILFTGWVSYDRLREIYGGLSVFVAPVKDDTFGSVSVYAMCSGIPVVGFDVGGIPEIVASSELLAPPGDVSGLAQIVVDLLGDRDRRIRIGSENQRRAMELFSVSAMASAFSELYESLIDGGRKSTPGRPVRAES